MLTLIALSALLMQDPPAPPAPPEVHTRFMIMGDGPGDLDKDGDGQITREEFAAPMNDHFVRMDKDNDGRLSTEELSTGRGSGEHVFLRGPGGEDGPGEHRFGMHHPGAPGAHEHEEHEVRTMVFTGRGEGGPGGEHEFVIHGPGGEGSPRIIRLPRGADGPGEHNVIVRRLGGPDGEHEMDADNDGRISEAEFTGPLREAFVRMDADHSGFIEEGERGQGNDVQVFTHRVETRQDRED